MLSNQFISSSSVLNLRCTTSVTFPTSVIVKYWGVGGCDNQVCAGVQCLRPVARTVWVFFNSPILRCDWLFWRLLCPRIRCRLWDEQTLPAALRVQAPNFTPWGICYPIPEVDRYSFTTLLTTILPALLMWRNYFILFHFGLKGWSGALTSHLPPLSHLPF